MVAWGASPAPQLADEAQMRSAKLLFDNQTIREIVHTSIASDTVRVRLSNAYGKQAVEIGAVHIALRDAGHDKGSSIAPGSDHAVTFSGRASVSIAPNAQALSDPVKLAAPAAISPSASSCHMRRPARAFIMGRSRPTTSGRAISRARPRCPNLRLLPLGFFSLAWMR